MDDKQIIRIANEYLDEMMKYAQGYDKQWIKSIRTHTLSDSYIDCNTMEMHLFPPLIEDIRISPEKLKELKKIEAENVYFDIDEDKLSRLMSLRDELWRLITAYDLLASYED